MKNYFFVILMVLLAISAFLKLDTPPTHEAADFIMGSMGTLLGVIALGALCRLFERNN